MESKMMEKIVEKSKNRYEAITVISKEARRINMIMRLSDEEFEEKPTTIAMKRFIEGKVKYHYGDKKGEQNK